MAKKAEVKVDVTVSGASTAAGELDKVGKAGAGAADGGLKKLTKGIEGDLKNALGGTLPGASGDAATGLLGIAGPALGAGAAIASLALKGVADFQNLGVEIDNFSTATGTSRDAASRWVEVAGDLGVGADAVESAMGRMNKTAELSPSKFDEIGAAMVRNQDGTLNTEATFLGVIQRLQEIPDAGKQAAAGADIFGKGWQGMAQLIATGAPQLRADLQSVQPEKIFTDKDAKAAKGVRDGFDAIKDAGEGLMLTLGRQLAPVIADLAPKIAKIVEEAGPAIAALGEGLASAVESSLPLVQLLATTLKDLAPALQLLGAAAVPIPSPAAITGVDDYVNAWRDLKAEFTAVGGTAEEFQTMRESIDGNLKKGTDIVGLYVAAHEHVNDKLKAGIVAANDSVYATKNLTEESQGYANAAIHADDATADFNATAKETAKTIEQDMTAAAKHADDQIRDLTQSFDTLRGSISDDQAFLNLEGTFDNVRQKAADAFKAGADGADDAKQKSRDYKLSVDDLKQSIIDVAEKVDGISPEQTKKLLMEVDAGQLDAVEAQLKTIQQNATINVAIITKGGAGYAPRVGGAHAMGGPVEAGVSYPVGERGVEMFTPSANGFITPNSALGGGGGALTVHVHMPIGTNGDDVIRAIKKWERRNGPGWRS